MIDLHCHILPEVDDGAASLDESVRMARAAVGDGVHTIVATPHGSAWAYTGTAAETRERTAALQSELALLGVRLEILPGLEVYLTPDSPNLYARGEIFTLNTSRYMLVEFPFQGIPPNTEQTLFELQLRGVVPVIAHPERNAAIASDQGILHAMVARGMLAQVTAGSLLGFFGVRIQRVAETLLESRLVHVIASDGHPMQGRWPLLSKAVERASELIGEQSALDMVTTTPAAILRDEEVVAPEPQPAELRRWFRLGRSK